MQISSSVPSAVPSAETGSGCDALFEEVAPFNSEDTDPADSDAAGGFAAMILAALVTATPCPPASPEATAVSEGIPNPGNSTNTDVEVGGDSFLAGETNGRPAETLPAMETAGPSSASTNPVDLPASIPAQNSPSATPKTAFVDQQDAADALVAREEAVSATASAGEADGQSNDDLALTVEQVMESFTPIPASVLALMRAGSVDRDPAGGTAPTSEPSTLRPLAARSLAKDADAADTELFGDNGDATISLIPAIEFATTRAADTDSFAKMVGAHDDRSGDPLPDRSATPDLAALPPQPGASLPGSTPLGGRDQTPSVPATREALADFTIDQVVTRSSGNGDEPVSRIEARIAPPELGRISIEISRSPEGLTAHLTVEDSSVLALLDQQMKEVRQTLDAAGVPMASLTMSMSSGDDAPRQQSQRDDEPLTFATSTRAGRSANARTAGATRREIDTTA